MDLKIDIESNKTSDEGSTKSPADGKCTVKHFKKSMIVEYEKIEHVAPIEDSQSSVSSSSSSSTSRSSSGSSTRSSTDSVQSPISFADTSLGKCSRNDEENITITGLLLPTNQALKENTTKKKEVFDNKRKRSNEETNTDQSNHSQSNKPDKSKTKINATNKSGKSNENKPNKFLKTTTFEREENKKDNQSKNKITYCICRSSDSQRFMIACDNCDEWYHGDCVGVSQSISKKIKAFYCHICRRKKLSLSIRYKSKFQEFLKNKSSHHTTTDPILIRFLKEIRKREKKRN